MKAGRFKQPITINQKVIIGIGDRGQTIPSWQTFASVRADVQDLAGRKLELARQLVATATHQITIRYLAGLTVEHQVVFDGRTFNINNIQNLSNNNFTQILTCTEQKTGAM